MSDSAATRVSARGNDSAAPTGGIPIAALLAALGVLACGRAEPVRTPSGGGGGGPSLDAPTNLGGAGGGGPTGGIGADPPSCTDGAKNGVETDLDCGGTSCAPCQVGQSCAQAQDCLNGVCTDSFCQPAGCRDNKLNGTETDLDCGGTSCAPCADGKTCDVSASCQSGRCQGGTCQAPRCDDGIKNGAEADVDCGAPPCTARCANGLTCTQPLDCQSGVCNIKCQSASCNDRAQNGSETDVDCGGTCNRCPDGKTCSAATDCGSSVCSVTCQTPTCSDGVRNGSETDRDCGGGACPGCPAGKHCRGDADCAAGSCGHDICQAVSCSDGVTNGSETDRDCGGSCARKCDVGQRCAGNGDCASAVCGGNVCLSPWRLQYMCSDTNATNAEIHPSFRIVSTGGMAPAPLAELTIRYWYTQETPAMQSGVCDYALAGNGNVTTRFQTLSPARPGANMYLEVGFLAAAGAILPGGTSGEVKVRFNSENFTTAYNEVGDYSFDPTKTAYADWDRVTLYHKGTLVWGREP